MTFPRRWYISYAIKLLPRSGLWIILPYVVEPFFAIRTPKSNYLLDRILNESGLLTNTACRPKTLLCGSSSQEALLHREQQETNPPKIVPALVSY